MTCSQTHKNETKEIVYSCLKLNVISNYFTPLNLGVMSESCLDPLKGYHHGEFSTMSECLRPRDKDIM